MSYSESLGHAYYYAKEHVIARGYAHEIDWQSNLCFGKVQEDDFLKEITWVILACGMSDKVVRKIYPKIFDAFGGFKVVDHIYKYKYEYFVSALTIFNHPKKIAAIMYVVEQVHNTSFEVIKDRIQNEGVAYIQSFPFMGKATSYHLAKNLGLCAAKPDRHLLRIAAVAGYKCPQEMCEQVANQTGEKVSVVDLIFWRFATLDSNYLRIFEAA